MLGKLKDSLKRVFRFFKYGLIEVKYINIKMGKELTKANSGFCLKGLCLAEPDMRTVSKFGRDQISRGVTIPSGWMQFLNDIEVKAYLLNLDGSNEKVILITNPQFNLEVGKA